MKLVPIDEPATPSTTASAPRRLVPIDEPQSAPRGVMNPYGLPHWQDRPLTSKLLPPFSPLQMGFTPQAERFGRRMIDTAESLGEQPGNAAQAMIGTGQPTINPPGVLPRVQRPSNFELGLRSAVPAALDVANVAPLKTAASMLTPRSLATGLATGPALEAATATSMANTPLRRLPGEIAKRVPFLRNPSVSETFTKAIRPSVAGKSSAGQIAKYHSRAEDAVKTIADFRSELALPDAAGNPVPRLPESLRDMSQAVEQTKFAIFKRYDALAKQTGKQGARIATHSAADAADQVVRNPIIQRYYPEIAAYAKSWATRLRQAKSHSPEEIQDLIAKMNADLDTYYKNPQPGSAARAVIDAGIANNLRKSLASVIESETGGQYQLYKNRYGALSTIEKDVNHRMVVFARQNKKGLVDFSDIFSGAEMVRGILTKDPATFAAGATAKGIAAWYRHINNPDMMVKRMFQGVAGRSAAPTKTFRGIITKTAERLRRQ